MYCYCISVPVWDPWGAWGGCSVTCGGGIRDRRRTCDVPETVAQGTFCVGPDIEQDTVPCNPENCPGKILCLYIWSTHRL